MPAGITLTRPNPRSKSKLHPTDVLKFEDHKKETEKIFRYLEDKGWYAKVRTNNFSLGIWIEFLQLNMRFYEYIEISKCLTTRDYFYGNLVQGPVFTEWLKKARAYTLQYESAIDEYLAIPEEYILDNYEGYDSFFPESGLIHWEEEIDDFPWCLYPIEVPVDRNRETKIFIELLHKLAPKELNLAGATDIISKLKASKFFDPSSRKSRLMRDLIVDPGILEPGWLGKRTKIQAFPGGGRDASMASPSTLQKIKLSNEIFLQIVSGMKNSAMTGQSLQERRIQRLRSHSKTYLHWDFKKIGLTADRSYFYSLARAVEDVYGIDMSWFDIDDLFIIDEDGITKKTRRGYALGWMNEAITIVIIRWVWEFLNANNLSKKVDFLVFNDDVEIGFLEELHPSESTYIKELMLQFFKDKGIPCSIKKIYFSYHSVFLEDYHDTSNQFNFDKKVVAVRLYAKAAISSFPFLRKSYVAAASEHWHSEEIIQWIVNRTSKEWKKLDEDDLSLASGGWFRNIQNYLNFELVDHPTYSLFAPIIAEHVNIGKFETIPFNTSFKSAKAAQSQALIIENAQRDYFDHIPKTDFEENFQSTTGAEIDLFRQLLPSFSFLKDEGAPPLDIFNEEGERTGVG